MKISSEKKKELQAQYKLRKTEMGIFAVINKSNAKHYVETTQDLKAKMNSTEFKLNLGSHPKKELQKEWQEMGRDQFEIKILEQIEHEKDEAKTDYTDDLALLEMLWIEKLIKEGIHFY